MFVGRVESLQNQFVQSKKYPVEFAPLEVGKIAYQRLMPEQYHKKVSPKNKQSPPPIIVFVHGGLASIQKWKYFPQNLCNHVGLPGLVFDRIGYGESDYFNFYKLSDQERVDFFYFECKQMIQLLTHVYPDQRQQFILYGHSGGGTTNLILSTLPEFKHRVYGLIHQGPHLYADEMFVENCKRSKEQFIKAGLIKSFERYHGKDKAQGIFDFFWQTWTNEYVIKNFNITETIRGKIDCHQVIIEGEKDPTHSRKQMETIVEMFPGKCYIDIVPGAGHYVHQEMEGEVLSRCLKFVDKIIN